MSNRKCTPLAYDLVVFEVEFYMEVNDATRQAV